MKGNSSSNINLILALLTLAALGCVCPKTSQRNSQTGNTANENLRASQTSSATASPSLSPTPGLPDFEKPEVSEHIKKGEAVYKRVMSSTGLPVMFGWRAKDITLMIPTRHWNNLTSAQKADLTYFMDTLPEKIRNNPETYVRSWSAYYRRTEQLESGGEFDGLDRDGYISNARSICSSCWSIATGSQNRDGFYEESYPVKGSTAESYRASIETPK